MIFSVSDLNKRIHFTTSSAEDAALYEASDIESAHFIQIEGSSSNGGVVDLSVIHAFCETMSAAVETHESVPIVVCVDSASPSNLGSSCLLCGAYLLLYEIVDFQTVAATFRSVLDMVSCEWQDGVIDCWKALARARDLRWVGTTSGDSDEPALDVEMASHYALPANGGVHVLVPGRLLLVPPPAQLPVGQSWADDVSEAGEAATRRFAAGFLADLLADLDVSAVACLGRTGESDAAAMSARGLDVHDLGLDPERPALLGAMDRLLAVSRAAPGAVAVFGYSGDAVAGTLAEAWLMAEHRFEAAAAAAWVRMVCPRLDGTR